MSVTDAINALDKQIKQLREDEESAIKITKARMKMVIQPGLRSAFFACQLMRLPLLLDRAIPTMATNGKSIRYNPSFVMEHTLEQLIGVLAHEIMHCTLLHHLRRNTRDVYLWNQACDLAINPLLVSSGFDLPVDGLFPAKEPFAYLEEGLSAEEYYERLLEPPTPPEEEENDNSLVSPTSASGDGGEEKEQESKDTSKNSEQEKNNTGEKPSDESGNDTADDEDTPEDDSSRSKDPGGCGGVEDYPDPSPAERAEQETTWKVNLLEAIETAKRAGCLPGCFQKLVEEIVKPKTDYRDLLRHYLSEAARNNYSWNKPNPRHLHHDLYLPGIRGNALEGLILALDTSGSIFCDPSALSFLMGEIQAILESYECTDVTVLCHDTEVTLVKQWNTMEGPFEMIPQGGGGTEHDCIFRYVRDNNLTPPVLISLTDMYSSFPRQAPLYPVIWLSTTKATDISIPPYGEFIYVGDTA